MSQLVLPFTATPRAPETLFKKRDSLCARNVRRGSDASMVLPRTAHGSTTYDFTRSRTFHLDPSVAARTTIREPS